MILRGRSPFGTTDGAARPRWLRGHPAQALTIILTLLAVGLASLGPATGPTTARADSGYQGTLAPFQVSLGHDTGTLTLATTTFVPSVGVVAAPDPSVDWGDGTSSAAAVPTLGTCVQCDLQGSHLYTAAGSYTIAITYYTGCCVSYTTSTSVDVITPTDRFVIAAIGDSAASGQGNPDQPRQPFAPAIWDDGTGPFGSTPATTKCFRSRYAPGAQAARRIQQENIYTSIDFTLLACSGAPIGVPIAQEIAAGNDLTANDTAIKQVTHLPPGHIDALLVLVGADNLDNGYSNVIETCLKDNVLDQLGNYRPPCEQDTTLTGQVASDLQGLPRYYDDLAAAIQARGDIGKVYITEYFDPTHNAEGTYGDDTSNFACTVGSMTAASWQWSHDDIVVPLNNAVAAAAAAHGWQFVGGIASQFLNHGFCAWTEGQNWVVALDSLSNQGDIEGTAHANQAGLAVYRDALTTAIYNGTPPMTSASAGAYTFGDITTQAVQVTLAAHNALAKAGVGTTYYAIDNPACMPSATATCLVYSGPFTMSDGGAHIVSFFSQNSHGTPESLKTVHVNIAYPTSVAWPPQQAITYGTALSAAQLDATASATTLAGASVGVPGTFAYSVDGSPVTPAEVLPAGPHTLAVQFTPNDTTLYTTPAAVSVPLTVNQAPLTITASSPSMIYGGTVPAFTALYSAFANGDTSSVVGGLTCGSKDANGNPVGGSTPAGAYTITCGGASASNYTISYKTGTLTINAAPLTITANDQTMILHGAVPTFTVRYGGFVNGETSSLVGGMTCGAVDANGNPVGGSTPAGAYTISCSGARAPNYAISYVSGKLSILYAPAGTTVDGDAGHTILQPTNPDGSSVFKQGSTVPAKFRVGDVNGVSIGTAGVVKSFLLVKTSAGVNTVVNEQVVSTTPDNAFRWDATSQQWIFNISTQGLVSGTKYYYEITLNDGSTIDFSFAVR